jgi:uncharacterized protein YfaS (alpha-2-macroglobulin family)
MGDRDRSNVAVNEGLLKGRAHGYWGYDYGSTLRDAAMSYALLERHEIENGGRDNLVAVIAGEMEKSRYYSTQEKLALFMVGRSYTGDGSESWTANVSTGEKPVELASKGTHFHELSASELADGIKLTNTHKDRLYVELSMTGNPVKQPAPKSDPIELTRALHAPDGTPISGRALRVGEMVIVRVTAKSKTPIATGMIVDRIPAGLEIENLNIVQGEQMGAVNIAGINPTVAMSDARIKHIEFRDDRFVAGVRLDHNPITLFYRARVVTPGKFVVPPLYAEDMYRPGLFGLVGGSDALSVIDAHGAAAKPVIAGKADGNQ